VLLVNQTKIMTVVDSSIPDVPPSTLSSPAQSHAYPKRTLHSKKSFHKHGPGAVGSGSVDSPAYDASEEDNDPTTDDGASSVVPVASRRSNTNAHSNIKNGIMAKKYLSVAAVDDEDPGVDSPTYDGDIESYTAPHPHNSLSSHHEQHSSSENTTSTLTSPISRSVVLPSATSDKTSVHHQTSAFTPSTPSPLAKGQPRVGAAPKFDPATATPSEIQLWVQNVIAGHSDQGSGPRNYKINPPPEGRPVVIYADGVYDLFHYGHALQLRQAKFSFPSVHLLVGVNSDELVKANKANTIMTHAERCEAVRNCKWADGVIPAAPWILTNDFLIQHRIDYVAHDENPYAASGHEDVYALAKAQGKFLPTRRTPGISTSLLLSRIVTQYRSGYFNSKLEQTGNEELRWRDDDDVSMVG